MTQLMANAVDKAVDSLKQLSKEVPSCAIILGSGVKVLENLDDAAQVNYSDIFGISPGVQGHAGSLSLGTVDGKLVAVMRGRFHLYEGHNWDVVSLVTRVITQWGVPRLYLTNAAGGLNQNFRVGDLMLLTGYRDLMNPKWVELGLLPALKGDNTDCRNALTDHLLAVSKELQKTDPTYRALQTGVYAGLLGPSYETLAEIEMLQQLKADAVGMSTVPELQTVQGTKTLAAAISVVTNVWSADAEMGGHDEVLEAAKEASERLDKLFRASIVSQK
jgi:purine-nucleoside phosphorylase